MKKIIAFLMASLMLASSAFAETDIKIKINNEDFETGTAAKVVNDRVMVPMRAIFEKFNSEVNWDGETKTIYATNESSIIVMQIGNNKMFANSLEIELDAPPMIEVDRTLVPLRAVSSSLGAEVNWNEEERTVYISYGEDDKQETVDITIEMASGGIMKAELYPDVAPVTVENFVKLANEGFYDGLIFHRVIPGFMIQGGGYDENYKLKEADSIVGEFSANGYKNDLKHTRGVLSMARTSVPNSASSQFFIMHEDAPHLDGQYAAFGKLTEGYEVLDAIAETETASVSGMDDVPVSLQVIKTIRVDKN